MLDAESAQKAARFVERCDAFGLPLLVLVDTPGFMPGAEQESAGVIRFGATLVRAFARATVPRLTVVLRKAYGGAFIAMNSRDLGADLVFAWPGAEIGVMSAHSATTIVRHRELAAAADPIALRRALVEAYAEEHLGADVAAAGGFVVLAQLPTLLLVAEASLIFAGAQRSRYRDALGAQLTETTVPNGHNVLWEAPEQTISAIAGFLAGLT